MGANRVSQAATTTSTAATAAPIVKGVSTDMSEVMTTSKRKAGQMGQRPVAERGPFEQKIAEEIERGAAGDGNRDIRIGMTLGMREQKLVPDRREDDAAHDRQMQIGVGDARHAARDRLTARSDGCRIRRRR